jgi:hypothetical protein
MAFSRSQAGIVQLLRPTSRARSTTFRPAFGRSSARRRKLRWNARAHQSIQSQGDPRSCSALLKSRE